MKHFNSALLPISVLFSFSLISCVPLIHYVGDKYPPTAAIDVYYSMKDIRRDYTIMGRMTRQLIMGEREKQEMVEEAKRKGAEGIIFYDLETDAGKLSVVSIKAELIRYK